jgi:DNA-binding response OmpR family regulator
MDVIRVLIVEDNADLAPGLRMTLATAGYDVQVAGNGELSIRAAEPPVRFGDVVVDPAAHVVERAGRSIDLSPKAFQLLIALLGRRGSVARREDLLRDVWGHQSVVATRTVDVHMLELRRKLERDPARPAHFLTVRKAGYRFQP